MKKIAILTATRAEYGLLKSVIKKLIERKEIDVKVLVTGMHLSPEFGMTVKEIEDDGILIDKKIEILLSSDSSVAVSKAMGLALISFSEYFENHPLAPCLLYAKLPHMSDFQHIIPLTNLWYIFLNP